MPAAVWLAMIAMFLIFMSFILAAALLHRHQNYIKQ